MKDSFATELQLCVEQVLETMFFTGIVGMTEGGEKGDCTDRLAAAIHFHGPPDGTFCLCLGRQAVETLAASFLSLEPAEVTPESREQVAGELANMICGSVLSRCAQHSFFRLEGSQAPLCQEPCDTCVSIEMPEGLMTICSRVDRL